MVLLVLILVPLPWADGVVLHTVTLGQERVLNKYNAKGTFPFRQGFSLTGHLLQISNL